MKKKIFLYFMVLATIGVTITGIFISRLVKDIYIHEVEEKLKSVALLIEHDISRNKSLGVETDYYKAAKTYADFLNPSLPSKAIKANEETIRTRITFIDYKGKVMGESEMDPMQMESHLNRKEIQEAIQGKTGMDIRTSRTLKIKFLYLALPARNMPIIIRVAVPLIQLRGISRIILYYTLAGIFTGLGLTALLAWAFSTSLIRPVKEIIKITNDFSMGDYSKRVVRKSDDELGHLSNTFNYMAEKLEKTITDLKDKNAKFDSVINSMTNGIVAVDTKYRIILINSIAYDLFGIESDTQTLGINMLQVIRNNQINTYLRETIEKNKPMVNEITVGLPKKKILRIYTNPIISRDGLDSNSGGILSIHDITNIKKLEQIRTEFVSNVTHELKTPLTSIRGFIETLRSGAINDAPVADKFLEIIDIEAERLYLLISDILQLSEIETMQDDTNMENCSFPAIISQVVSILECHAHKKEVTLSSDVSDNLFIRANKDRIKQLLINLIENGIKYNIPGGNVSIKAWKAEGKIVIKIKDTGIGISSEHLPRIFERFYRVDKGRSRSIGGTGLGLSIVKHIVNLYNGDIRVSSQLGEGTEFTIRLPV